MWYYYRQDVYEKEPIQFVALIFVLSMPLSVLAGLLEYTLDGGKGQLSEDAGFLIASLFYLCVVAVAEELAKFFVVFTVAYPNRAFNEPMDGIIYAAAAALGFASFENAFYVLDRGPLVLLLRGPFSTLGHVLFSAMWGAALGLALQEQRRARRVRLILSGLVLSILAHGLYNILVSLSYPFFGPGLEWLAVSGPVFLIFMFVIVTRKIRQALEMSHFKPSGQLVEPNEPGLPLPSAPQQYAPNPNRYQFRGGSTGPEPEPALTPSDPATQDCPDCGQSNLADEVTTNCYNCGSELTQKDDQLKKS